MALINSPNTIRDGLVLSLDAANVRSFRGEPTTNVFTHYGTPGYGAAGNVSVTFSIQGTGTFVRLGYGQTYGNYLIEQRDVVYRYDLGTSGCHYHGNTVSISSGQYATFTFDYYVSPETTIESSFLANFENYGGGAFGGSVSANGLKGVWQTATFTSGPATSNGTLAMFLYPGGCSSSRFGNTGYILYKNPQVELRSTSTPFVNGTRGTTNATGGGWVDLSSDSNHGELVNGPTYDSANGGSLVFDGSNDFVLSTQDATFGNETTWEAWVYCTANVSTYNMFMGRYLPYFGFYSGNRLYFSNNIGGSQRTIQTATNLSLNTWYHATFTTSYDGTNTTMKIYTNGVETATGTWAGVQGNYSYKFMIGDGNNSANNSWYPFQGRIANVKVYSKKLTGNEILQNFEATRARFGV